MTAHEAAGNSAPRPEAARRELAGNGVAGREAARPAAILIGPPGAGKSTVGPLLAGLLGVGFADTDGRVEAVAGKPVSDVFVEDGEAAFRALERAAVASAIAEHRGVLGLGGGAILDPGTRALLTGQPVVYLETGFAEAAKRVGMDRPRPLLIGNPRALLRTLLAQRLPVYQQLAWITVSTDHRAPEDIAADIAARLHGAGAAGATAADTAADTGAGAGGGEAVAGTEEPGRPQ
jgi:shikimate kinase